MGELRRITSEALDIVLEKHFHELKKNLDRMSETTDRMLRATNQRLANAEHDSRQPRLATEADVPTNKKTRKSVADAAAGQAKHGDSCCTKRVDSGQTSSTSLA